MKKKQKREKLLKIVCVCACEWVGSEEFGGYLMSEI